MNFVRGFKDFVMRGNLVELAVAFIMAAAFTAVVTAFTTMLMDVLGKIGGKPDFSSYNPGGVSVGAFLTALVAFVILAAVVYFLVVLPYEEAKKRFTKPEEAATAEEIELLREIRDSLRARNADTD